MPGDPFKRIAWKASARRGKLVVREMERDQRDVVWLVVDASVELWAGEPGHAPLDHAVEEIASVAARHLARGDRVGLVVTASRMRSYARRPESGPVAGLARSPPRWRARRAWSTPTAPISTRREVAAARGRARAPARSARPRRHPARQPGHARGARRDRCARARPSPRAFPSRRARASARCGTTSRASASSARRASRASATRPRVAIAAAFDKHAAREAPAEHRLRLGARADAAARSLAQAVRKLKRRHVDVRWLQPAVDLQSAEGDAVQSAVYEAVRARAEVAQERGARVSRGSACGPRRRSRRRTRRARAARDSSAAREPSGSHAPPARVVDAPPPSGDREPMTKIRARSLREAGLLAEEELRSELPRRPGRRASRSRAAACPTTRSGARRSSRSARAPGALTVDARSRARARVVAIERDRDLVPLLTRDLRRVEPTLEIVEADAEDRSTTPSSLGDEPPFVLCGNLPYQAHRARCSSWRPSSRARLERAVFMVQREVAERLAAEPGTKEYGALTVFVRAAFDVATRDAREPGCFFPPPDVDERRRRARRRGARPHRGDAALPGAGARRRSSSGERRCATPGAALAQREVIERAARSARASRSTRAARR